MNSIGSDRLNSSFLASASLAFVSAKINRIYINLGYFVRYIPAPYIQNIRTVSKRPWTEKESWYRYGLNIYSLDTLASTGRNWRTLRSRTTSLRHLNSKHWSASTSKPAFQKTVQFAFLNIIMEEPNVQNLVKSIANKQQANKRKRDPDMYLDAVLECTVRRLNRERMECDEVSRKRRRLTIREADETGSCGNSQSATTPPDQLLMNSLKTADCSRTFIGDTISALDESECGKMDQHLDDELSGDLKELLDELAREFPGDFWLTDSNNNNCSSLMPSETDDVENDLWLSNIIEVLCSSWRSHVYIVKVKLLLGNLKQVFTVRPSWDILVFILDGSLAQLVSWGMRNYIYIIYTYMVQCTIVSLPEVFSFHQLTY